MNISYRGIPKYAGGSNLWYTGIQDYDPKNYVSDWDYERGLVAGDVTDIAKSGVM